MTDTNPLQFRDRLRETLVRYLTTTIGVSEDHPDLARRIRAELETGAALVKGPFLETLPDFEKGRSTETGPRWVPVSIARTFGRGGCTVTKTVPSRSVRPEKTTLLRPELDQARQNHFCIRSSTAFCAIPSATDQACELSSSTR
jgi:hypothetical protein